MCGVDVRVFGDEIDPEENSMLIMNHRTRYAEFTLLRVCLIHQTAL